MGEQGIGILGGMGPEATLALYERLLTRCQERGAVQDSDYPRIFVDSVPFRGSDEGGIVDEDAVRDQCLASVEALERAGADVILVPCVTLHVLLDSLSRTTTADVVDVIDETLARIDADGRDAVGLLASETTYAEGIYRDRTDDVEFLLPDESDRGALSSVIRNVMGGQRRDEDRETVRHLADALERRGAEALVVGCTELSVAIGPGDLEQDVYDAIEILADVGIERV